MLQIVAFEFFLVCLAATELAVSCIDHLNSCMLAVVFHGVYGMQGFRRGHSGLVALKAVNTALIMLYCHSEPHYLCFQSLCANVYHPVKATCEPSVPMLVEHKGCN